jgi:4-amino-4-deoxy-L-arabinose transferase-like glycosyltransferase
VTAFALALFSVAHAAWSFGPPDDPVFTDWDAVVSWNRWAVDWAANRLPERTYHYPQLVPANLSLTYVLMGTTRVEAFARVVMGAFEVAIPLALLVEGIRRRRPGDWIGAALAARLMWVWGARASGSVDTAVACLALFAWLALAGARDAGDSARRWAMLLGAALAGAAAVTKQSGLWVAAVYPLVCLVVGASEGGRARARTLAVVLAVLAVVVVPWYVYKELAIRAGADLSELGTVLGAAHGGRAPLERMGFALATWDARMRIGPLPGAVTALLLGAACVLAARDRLARALLLLVVVPQVGLWALLWSYDGRNLAAPLPLAGWLE